MPTFNDVRRVALGLPEAVADGDHAFRVNGKLFAWPWLERISAGKPRVPNLGVLVVRVADEVDKGVMIEMNPRVFFTEPHYDGYPAVLVRLSEIDEALLAKVIGDAWRSRAPKRLTGTAPRSR